IARIFFDARERRREVRLFQAIAELEVAQKNAPALRPRLQFLQRVVFVEHALEKWSDDESVRGELARRLDELTPFQFAVALVREHQSRDGAGYADGLIAISRRVFDDVAVRIEVHVARRRQRRALAIINPLGRSVGGANEHESAAAEVAGGRPGDGERE